MPSCSRWLFGTMTLFLVPRMVHAQGSANAADAIIKWMKTHAAPVSVSGDTAIVLSPKAQAAVRDLSTKAAVVGIGESMHDSHELSLVRGAITKALMADGNVAAVVLESSLLSARRTDRWVSGESDSLPAFDRDLSYGWGREKETLDLLDALRRYNLRQPKERRIRFYGMDLPANGGGSVVPALNPACAYLATVDSAFAAASRALVLPLARSIASDGYGIVDKYAQLSRTARDSLRTGIQAVVDQLTRNADLYIRRSSREDYDWALRAAEIARQTETAVRVGWNDGSNPRDAAMARNVEWIQNREGRRGRVIVWSHNLHVARGPITGPVFAGRGGASSVMSMGEALDSAFGKRYVSIGTAFGKSLMDESPIKDDPSSVDAMFASLHAPGFLLRLDGAPAPDPIASWLTAAHPKRVEGGYVMLSLRPAFDAVVYVDRVKSANHTSSQQ